jgi:rhodanese-related sulfurtransferase
MEYKEIWIDIREEHELAENQIVSPNENDVLVINIPSRNIFANVEWMERISQKGVKITLICRSASRSKKVKDIYFTNNENITSLEKGISNPNIKLKPVVTKTNLGLGLQQILQLVFSTILLFIFVSSFFIKIEVVRYTIIAIIAFILYQVITKSCLIGKIVPLPQ